MTDGISCYPFGPPEAKLLLGYSPMTEQSRGTSADPFLRAVEASHGQRGLKESSLAQIFPAPVLPATLSSPSPPSCALSSAGVPHALWSKGSSAFSGSFIFTLHSHFPQLMSRTPHNALTFTSREAPKNASEIPLPGRQRENHSE